MDSLKQRSASLLARQPVRYVISGGISYGVELLAFLALFYSLGLRGGIANALSLIISWIVNYLLSHHFVFRGHQSPLGRSLPRYATLAIFNLAASSLLIELLISRFGVPGYIAKPVLSLVFVAWTYVAYKKFVFVAKSTT